MNFLRTVLGSCAGLRFYRVALEWSRGGALGYFAKLCLLLALIFAAINVPRFLRMADEAGAWIKREKFLPELTIEHGKVRSPAAQPYQRLAGDLIFILDTTGATALAPTGAVNGILVTSDRVLAWSDKRVLVDQPVAAMLPDGRVDAAYFTDLMRLFVRIAVVPMLGILFGAYFAGGMLQSLLFCAIASMMERSLKPRYSFSQLFRISVLALTPAAIVGTAYSALGLATDWLPLLYLGIYYFYLSGATAVCRPLLLQRAPVVEEKNFEE